MAKKLSERGIVWAVAEQAGERVARKVILALQKLTDTMSDDDSELTTVWDEICVQIQFQQSIFWDAYDETVRGIVARHVAELPEYESEALWLQTLAGEGWDAEEPESRDAYPVADDDITDHVIGYVYSRAADWSNARIRAFFERRG